MPDPALLLPLQVDAHEPCEMLSAEIAREELSSAAAQQH